MFSKLILKILLPLVAEAITLHRENRQQRKQEKKLKKQQNESVKINS